MPFAEGVPTATIDLDGKSYTLGWTWAARRRVQEVLKARHADPQNVDRAETMAVAVWASLEKQSRESLSVEDIEEMIHPRNEVKIMQTMDDLISASEPDPDPNANPAAVTVPTAGDSLSKNSGQSVFTT